MKKLALMTLVAAACTQGYAAEEPKKVEGPKISGALYPRLDIEHTWTKNKETGEVTKNMGNPKLSDDASRLRITGKEKLNDQVDVAYRLEWRVPHDVNERSLEPRDAWVALTHKTYGTLKAGRLLTPDPYVNYGVRSTAVDGIRANNGIRYESPDMKGTSVMVHYIMHEGKEKTDDLGTDGYAATITHSQKDKFSVGATYLYTDSLKATHGYQIKYAMRLTGEYYPTPDWRIGTLYQQNRRVNMPYTERGLGTVLTYQKSSFNPYISNSYVTGYGGNDSTYKDIAVGIGKEITKNVSVDSEVGFGRTDTATQRDDSLWFIARLNYNF